MNMNNSLYVSFRKPVHQEQSVADVLLLNRHNDQFLTAKPSSSVNL